MKTRHIPSLFALCGALSLLGGCATGPESRRVSAPPPQAPTVSAGRMPAAQPAVTVAAPGQGTTSYVVIQAPPAPQPEAVPERPSSQHVWIAGYWTWQNNGYAWMAGHWELPPSSTAVWVDPRWTPEGGSYRFYEGYWKN